MPHAYIATFSFGEVAFSDDDEELNEFEEIKDAINMCEDGLYDKICAYLHKYAKE